MMDLGPILPEILLAALAVAVLAADWVLPKEKKHLLGAFSSLGLAAVYWAMHVGMARKWIPDAANLSMTLPNGSHLFLGFVVDALALYFKKLFLVAALFVLVFSGVFFPRDAENFGEYHALLILVTLGAFLLVGASDLLTVFVSFELMSIPLYVLCGFLKRDRRSGEAGLKYFIVGAVTSALLVYGISLVYASLGTTDLRHLVSPGPVTLTRLGEEDLLLFGFLFVLVPLLFKIAAVPFHLWAPDVYEGAPAPVTAFLAVVPKIAVIALLLRIFVSGMPEAMPLWGWLFGLVGALSMTIGNLLALHQQNLKRLLAYSGISQMGYVLIGLAAIGPVSVSSPPFLQYGYQAVLFYMAAYLFSDLAAFGIVTWLSRIGIETVNACRGLAARFPGLSLIFVIALLSLAGIPPLVGFVGKFYLLVAAFASRLYALVMIGVANSVLSLFYYLRIAKAMYFEREGEPRELPRVPIPMQMALVIASSAVVFIGIFPRVIIDSAQSALQRFLSVFY